ncbi:MAG: UvrD-helicase domain-containing protein, partial [Myxococcales bacterium]|nr:UvrD-helicase domain-containing protein [Myxococcales bacterium]
MRFCVREGRPALDETDPELMLTEEQQAAVRPGREVVLEAGAGAGKTHTLALRYVALLVDVAWTEDAVERVLVLTFTEKAADEMAERCRRRLAEAAAAAQVPLPGVDPEGQRRQAENLRRMVDRFERARIGTFHGFCARLLREFPAACRAPVGVEVLDAPEARAWTEEALQDALDDLVRDRPAELGPLLDALGSRGNLLTAGRAAVEARGALRPVLEDHATGRDRLSELVAAAPVSAEEARARVAAATKELGLLLRLVAPSGGGPFAEVVRAALAEPPDLHDPLVAWARYRELVALPLNAKGDLRSLDHPTVLGLKEAWPDQRRYTQAREGAKVLAARMADWPARHRLARRLPTPADRTLLQALVPFSRWVIDALDRLDRRLDEERRVTFDLLQQRAVDAVLRDPVMRGELRRRHRYLVVDEFQDTDERQWSLVRALARQDPDRPEDRVFVVGDPKQAIYGFRGADVYAYLEAAAKAGSRSTLATNFRSDQPLLDAYDAFFGNAQLGDADISYREVEAPDRHQGLGMEGAPSQASLRFRMLRRSSFSSLAQSGEILADHSNPALDADIAADIAELLSSGARVREALPGGVEGMVPVVPGHVAVLVRTNWQAARIRNALAELGVPAVINGAGSVFLTEIASEWRRLLVALDRPSSKQKARGAALTSFFGWTPQQLADADDADFEVIHRKLHRYARILRERGVAAMVEEMSAIEGIPARMLAREDGERDLTDLRHIAQLLHAEAVNEGRGLSALTAWLYR